MKVLLVSNMYPSSRHPHYGVFVKNTEAVLREMPDMCISKVVLTKKDGKAAKMIGYILFYLRILAAGLFRSYDLIYAHFISHVSIPLRLLKKLRPKIKLVLNAHGNDVVADTDRDLKWVSLSHKIVPQADTIIVPSDYFRQVMQDSFHTPAHKLLVYPSGGINTANFYPRDPQAVFQKYALDPQKRYVGYISRIETNKGWDVFLKMAALLKDQEDLRFIVVGDGADRSAFDAMAAALRIEDKLIRFPLLSQDEIAGFFSILNVFCFPTRRKSESLGLVGLEAMACGCPVVAGDQYGPASYMIDGINGFTFSPESHQQLADKVRQVLSLSDAQTRALQEGMSQTVCLYSQDTANKTLLQLFSQFESH